MVCGGPSVAAPQAREIVGRLDSGMIREALTFAGIVLAVVIAVRVAWVLLFNRIAYRFAFLCSGLPPASFRLGIVVSSCGLRGLVTLGIALALPADFPFRDVIVLSALALGTLILQGLTLGPLIRLLRIEPDDSFGRELAETRLALLDTVLGSIADGKDEDAERLRAEYAAERAASGDGSEPHGSTEIKKLRRELILLKRKKLAEMRRNGEIGDDVFHAVEEELDWAELAAYPRNGWRFWRSRRRQEVAAIASTEHSPLSSSGRGMASGRDPRLMWWKARRQIPAGYVTLNASTQTASAVAQPSAPRRSGEVCPGMVAQPPVSTNCRFL